MKNWSVKSSLTAALVLPKAKTPALPIKKAVVQEEEWAEF
ncbi:hypothetical protein SAMN04487959_1348 [Modicisalibacter xianhensis]|uniref:Uncharacterized protein n=1 Tax=Modicisalibacter xianhensis TaxID=442341 RepID=A0A1I3GKX7_9GAMM|nr:hypothetical protein SAMN04487959_1348 [Halomonas xianhensis]